MRASLNIERFEFWLEKIALDRVHVHHFSKLDLGEFGAVFDFGDALNATPGKEKDWRQMNEEERSACTQLGWTEQSWMDGDDAAFNRS